MKVVLQEELREFIEFLIESGDHRAQNEVFRKSLLLRREKPAESHLQARKDLLAEGLSSSKLVE